MAQVKQNKRLGVAEALQALEKKKKGAATKPAGQKPEKDGGEK